MRRSLIALALAFAFALGLGLGSTAPASADPTLCFYKCVCPGVPGYCCVTATGTACKPVTGAPISCPQVAC
jgi:hypothetical protein